MDKLLEAVFNFCEALSTLGENEKRLAICLGTAATAYTTAKATGNHAELVELESVCLALTIRAAGNGGVTPDVEAELFKGG